MFLWGSSGTGKTVLSLETLKIKLSHFKSQNKTVKVIVTQSYTDDNSDPFLLENIRQKYLVNIRERFKVRKKKCGKVSLAEVIFYIV